MKSLKLSLLLLGAALFFASCGADVVVTQGAVAEGKKQEAAQAKETKEVMEEKIDGMKDIMEKRKQELDEKMDEQ